MLSVKNLSCGYGKTDVVKNVSFSVEKGEKLCIIGPNGCGKTTLLRAISGLMNYRGEILLNNKSIASMKRKEISKIMALMTQLSSVYFSYSIYEAVALGRYLASPKKIFSEETSRDREVINSCLENVGLFDIKDKPITELSGGQLQRVFLARVFAQEPEIILLDEPTNHLDLKHQLELVEYLKIWAAEKNRSVIGVMHDLNLAMQLADKIILMDNGKVKAQGTPQEIMKSETLIKAYGIDVREHMKNSLSVWNK